MSAAQSPAMTSLRARHAEAEAVVTKAHANVDPCTKAHAAAVERHRIALDHYEGTRTEAKLAEVRRAQADIETEATLLRRATARRSEAVAQLDQVTQAIDRLHLADLSAHDVEAFKRFCDPNVAKIAELTRAIIGELQEMDAKCRVQNAANEAARVLRRKLSGSESESDFNGYLRGRADAGEMLLLIVPAITAEVDRWRSENIGERERLPGWLSSLGEYFTYRPGFNVPIKRSAA